MDRAYFEHGAWMGFGLSSVATGDVLVVAAGERRVASERVHPDSGALAPLVRAGAARKTWLPAWRFRQPTYRRPGRARLARSASPICRAHKVRLRRSCCTCCLGPKTYDILEPHGLP
jgi:hypothetical protein